jgi:cell division protein ZapA
MKVINVSIGGKSYPLKVDDSDEQMMVDIARMVDERLKNFRKALATQPETTALVMAGLSIAEELYLAQRNAEHAAQNGQLSEAFSTAVKNDLEKIINSIR